MGIKKGQYFFTIKPQKQFGFIKLNEIEFSIKNYAELSLSNKSIQFRFHYLNKQNQLLELNTDPAFFNLANSKKINKVTIESKGDLIDLSDIEMFVCSITIPDEIYPAPKMLFYLVPYNEDDYLALALDIETSADDAIAKMELHKKQNLKMPTSGTTLFPKIKIKMDKYEN